MEFGLSTTIIEDKDIFSQIPMLSKYRIKRIELRANLKHFEYNNYKKIDLLSQKLDKFGITVYSIHMPLGNVDVSREEKQIRNDSIIRIKEAGSALQRLGGNMLVVHGGAKVENKREKRVQISLESLKELSDFCLEGGLNLAVENTLPGRIGDKIEELLYILGRLDSPNTGVCLDTGHINVHGDPTEALRKVSGRLIHIHIADNLGENDDHLLPGEGTIDWEKFIAALNQINYKGILMLEVVRNGKDIEERLEQVNSVFRRFSLEALGS
ncbi:MAG: sugar phosphate isomerase/epimerase family protein [Candidatus Aerophobetes bacterium]|nr:sugar phosphate isomerase/epimerase family protein [Candidatus Aerophobetes bacterium]